MTTDNRTNEPRRLKSCVERWPECETGEYNQSCCRFPKSCSATVYSEEHVTEDDLEPPAALGAAQGAAPQAESADHEKLIARLTGSVNALSVTCGECGSKPGNRCYGGGEMRRGHTSREAKAERALRIEAADALAALVLPSSGVDEDALAEVIEEARREWRTEWIVMQEREEPVPTPPDEWTARAVAEWLKEQGGDSRGDR